MLISWETLYEADPSVRAAEVLQTSSVIYKQASVETIEREGFYRVGDYLRSLPQ